MSKRLVGAVLFCFLFIVGCGISGEDDSVSLLKDILTNTSQTEDVKQKLEAVRSDLISNRKVFALGKLDEILVGEPQNYEVLALQATISISEGMWDRAISTGKRMVELKPDEASYFYLGQAYGGNQMFPEAIEALKKVIEMNPNNIGAHQALGVTYAEAGDIPNAEKEVNYLRGVDSMAASSVRHVIKGGKVQR